MRLLKDTTMDFIEFLERYGRKAIVSKEININMSRKEEFVARLEKVIETKSKETEKEEEEDEESIDIAEGG